MRLVVANPGQVRLDGPIAAPGRVLAASIIGADPPIFGSHKDKALNDRATARAGPAQASFACA